MKENIEDTIKQLEIILKIRKEQEKIIECAGGFCVNCKPDIDALEHSIKILSDYKKVVEENEELKEQNKYEWIRQHCLPQDLINKYYIPKQKIKDKIEELEKIQEILEEQGYWGNNDLLIKLELLQELLEEE